jgi:hypothetical protein
MLDGAGLFSKDADPPYHWGFNGNDFWIARREASPLPKELLESLFENPAATPWVQGKWSLGGDGFVLKLTEITGPGGATGRDTTVPVAVADLLQVTIGRAPYAVQENAARQPPSFAQGQPVAFEDRQSNQWGYKDARSGKVILPPFYERAWEFTQEGIACVIDGEPGFIKMNGEHLLEPFWINDGPDPFVENRARYVDEYKRMGFFDMRGEICIPANWEYVSEFQGGIALVSNDGNWDGADESRRYTGGVWGAIDSTGQVVVQVRYPFLERGPGNTFRDSTDGGWFRPGGATALARE